MLRPRAQALRYLRRSGWILALSLLLGGVQARQARDVPARGRAADPAIPVTEFARMVNQFSEEGGYFRSDNLVSNETAYLFVMDTLRTLEVSGGAYLGVGPEQNFSYIARIRPQIAFIVDIRRQAIIQHLMFKALFHLADTRTRFLSLLFSKPATGPGAPGAGASAEDLVDYFSSAATDGEAFSRNLARIQSAIVRDFQIHLDARDKAGLEYVYRAFRDENLDLRYQSGGFTVRYGGYGRRRIGPWGYFPSFRDLILARDLKGKLGNFLASRGDYEFVRRLQEGNRIIPVVGDFAGGHALSAVAAYLKTQRLTVSAFYTSNVEQYLFQNGVFRDFAENVARLPLSDRSVFIRAYPNQRLAHPAQVGNHRLTTLMQKIRVFLDDYRNGLYTDYWNLVSTHYIAPTGP